MRLSIPNDHQRRPNVNRSQTLHRKKLRLPPHHPHQICTHRCCFLLWICHRVTGKTSESYINGVFPKFLAGIIRAVPGPHQYVLSCNDGDNHISWKEMFPGCKIQNEIPVYSLCTENWAWRWSTGRIFKEMWWNRAMSREVTTARIFFGRDR